MARLPVSEFRRATARRLRKNETEAERLLWKGLRTLPAEGTHFRRQVPIGSYVADFACLTARLVIEVDGSQHADAPIAVTDRERTAWLEREGYRVIRFWNGDVLRDLENVLQRIYAEIYGSPSAEAVRLRHRRSRLRTDAAAVTPPRRASRADPPPPGEGGED